MNLRMMYTNLRRLKIDIHLCTNKHAKPLLHTNTLSITAISTAIAWVAVQQTSSWTISIQSPPSNTICTKCRILCNSAAVTTGIAYC